MVKKIQNKLFIHLVGILFIFWSYLQKLLHYINHIITDVRKSHHHTTRILNSFTALNVCRFVLMETLLLVHNIFFFPCNFFLPLSLSLCYFTRHMAFRLIKEVLYSFFLCCVLLDARFPSWYVSYDVLNCFCMLFFIIAVLFFVLVNLSLIKEMLFIIVYNRLLRH